MKKAGLTVPLAAAAGILMLILDSKTALQGAQEGLSLCIRTAIPSLFPFFVFSILLTGSLTGRRIPLLRPIGRLTGVPEGAESIFLTGILGGYPVGAQSIASTYKSGHLSRTDARRMMGFCSNAGPSFLFGIIGPMFSELWMVWALWAIHIVSALLAAFFLPGKSNSKLSITEMNSISLPDALHSALRVMGNVCGWIVLFRIVLAFLNRWVFWALPEVLQVLLSGILELTNGCCGLSAISDCGLRFLVCSGMLAFGGLCVTMQTASVASEMGLGYYFPGKLMQAVFSIILSVFVQSLFPARFDSNLSLGAFRFAPFVILLFIVFLGIWRNNCSIYAKHRV